VARGSCRGVDGEDDGFAAGGFGAVEVVLHSGDVGGGVELLEEDLGAIGGLGGGDLFDGEGGVDGGQGFSSVSKGSAES
jgi:hypothetical protein